VNLRQLEYVLAIARCRSFTAAAEEIGIAQPTLTRSVRALEEEFGADLFDRLARGVVPTEVGRAVIRHAETINLQVRDVVDEVSMLRGRAGGQVSIGAGPTWLRLFLPQAVARVISNNPSLRVSVDGGSDDALLRALRSGDVDFILAELPSPELGRDLDMRELISDTLVVCCRQAHALATRQAIGLKDLLAYPWIMPPIQSRGRQRLGALFVASDLPVPDIAVETESLAFMVQMVLHSDALTLMVRTNVQFVENNHVVALDVPELTAKRDAGLILRKGAWVSPGAQLVIDEVKRITTD
jgi:LysR family transcriptional regulator of gallate degradation